MMLYLGGLSCLSASSAEPIQASQLSLAVLLDVPKQLPAAV